MTNFDIVWTRIKQLEGSEFRQKTGKPFRYSVRGETLSLSTTNQNLPRAQFEQAFGRTPLRGPGELQDLRGPSYLYAILTDPRITG